MKMPSIRKLHMGCGEPLSAVMTTRLLRLDRRGTGSRSPNKQAPRPLLRKARDG